MPRKPKMTDEERRAYSARMRGELEAVMDRAYGAMVASEEFWATVMRTAANLTHPEPDRDRSPVNCIAIAAQCPHATRVLSSGGWRKAGRFPVKGATSLRIWTPIKRRRESTQEVTAAAADGGRREVASDAAEGEVRKVSGFKAGPVFDISQTDGDAYDSPAPARFTAEAVWAVISGADEVPDAPGECDYAVRLHLYGVALQRISGTDAPVYGQREAEVASAAHVAALILGVAPGPAAVPPLAGIITQDKRPPIHESAVRVIETGRAIARAVTTAAERRRELAVTG